MTQFMTPEAHEAFKWMINRMPDNVYKAFAIEMEAALRTTATRFGLDDEIISAFHVEKLLPERPELGHVEEDEAFQTLEAQVYFTGEKHYAVLDSGQIFHKGKRNAWRPARVTFDYVLSQSITRVSETIKLKEKYL